MVGDEPRTTYRKRTTASGVAHLLRPRPRATPPPLACMWACKVCTLEQSDKRTTCAACLSVRPDLTNEADVLIKPRVLPTKRLREGKDLKPESHFMMDEFPFDCPACMGKHRPHICGKSREQRRSQALAFDMPTPLSGKPPPAKRPDKVVVEHSSSPAAAPRKVGFRTASPVHVPQISLAGPAVHPLRPRRCVWQARTVADMRGVPQDKPAGRKLAMARSFVNAPEGGGSGRPLQSSPRPCPGSSSSHSGSQLRESAHQSSEPSPSSSRVSVTTAAGDSGAPTKCIASGYSAPGASGQGDADAPPGGGSFGSSGNGRSATESTARLWKEELEMCT